MRDVAIQESGPPSILHFAISGPPIGEVILPWAIGCPCCSGHMRASISFSEISILSKFQTASRVSSGHCPLPHRPLQHRPLPHRQRSFVLVLDGTIPSAGSMIIKNSAILILFLIACRVVTEEQFHCKPRPGCYLPKCDPEKLPLTPEVLRRNEYPITCVKNSLPKGAKPVSYKGKNLLTSVLFCANTMI